jgi:O-antigen/teichoic acid export membrane protein
MLGRNIKVVFSTNFLMLSSGVVTSLLSAWALGPTGRGDLMVVLMWPAIFSMTAQMGLPQAYRYWTAKRPECVNGFVLQRIVFTLVVGLLTLAVAQLLIPAHDWSPQPGSLTTVSRLPVNYPLPDADGPHAQSA